MSDLKQLTQIDWWQVFLAICLLLFCIKAVWSLFDWLLFEKLGIETRKMKQERQDRELLKATAELAKTTAENLDKLQSRHTKDEEEFRKNLNNYIEESREDRKVLHEKIVELANNRVSDRKKSLEIQKELKDSITSRDDRIDLLMAANKEMLAEKINEKYKHYISIGGIPEDELDEFVSMRKAYNGVGGNSHGDAKFKYCMEHLPVIPVETKLVIEHNK